MKKRSQALFLKILPLTVLVAIALLRGFAYANLMPPWAIIDEEQHVHYIQVLSEQGRRPIPDKDYLSDKLIASLFEANRWETYGFVEPPSMDPRQMGLEGYSYEGYQPPLYYLLMVPVYRLSSGGMLQTLFNLRWATVVLSTVAILCTYVMALQLTGSKTLAILAGLVLTLIPERTVAVSRVNNDALLQVFAAAYLCLAIKVLYKKPTDRRSVFLGMLLGLGTLSKMSMILLGIALPWVFWGRREEYPPLRGMVLAGGAAVALIVPLGAFNILNYGSLTGFNAVAPLLTFPPPAWSLSNTVTSLTHLFVHTWVILWQSAQASMPIAFILLYALLLIVSLFAAYGHVRKEQERRFEGAAAWRNSGISLLAVLLGIYALFTLSVYWRGQVPVIQGRFLLPVMPAIATLLVLGLWKAPKPVIGIVILASLLLVVDGLSLFAHLLPQYYPPLPAEGDALIRRTALDLASMSQRFGRFKPETVQNLLRATIGGYLIAQTAGFFTTIACSVTSLKDIRAFPASFKII